jgi:hypothetical protein
MPNAPREFAAREGLCCVHAYDDPAVVAGRGTVGLEIIADGRTRRGSRRLDRRLGLGRQPPRDRLREEFRLAVEPTATVFTARLSGQVPGEGRHGRGRLYRRHAPRPRPWVYGGRRRCLRLVVSRPWAAVIAAAWQRIQTILQVPDQQPISTEQKEPWARGTGYRRGGRHPRTGSSAKAEHKQSTPGWKTRISKRSTWGRSVELGLGLADCMEDGNNKPQGQPLQQELQQLDRLRFA